MTRQIDFHGKRCFLTGDKFFSEKKALRSLHARFQVVSTSGGVKIYTQTSTDLFIELFVTTIECSIEGAVVNLVNVCLYRFLLTFVYVVRAWFYKHHVIILLRIVKRNQQK